MIVQILRGIEIGAGSPYSVRTTFTNASLSTGVLTLTHNLGLTAPYSLVVDIFDNNGKKISPDDVTGATNSVAIDLTSYGSIAGTWEAIYLTGSAGPDTASFPTLKGTVSLTDTSVTFLPTGKKGFLKVFIGDMQEYFYGEVASAGTVHLSMSSTNVGIIGGVDGKLNIYSSGGGAVIENQLGSTLTVAYIFDYI